MNVNIDSKVTKNGVCVDWFEFTLKVDLFNGSFDPSDNIDQFYFMLDFLELPLSLSWVPGWAQLGYRNCMTFGNIFIFYNPSKPDMGIHCRMSGQGCRNFEKYSRLKSFDSLFKEVILFNTDVDLGFSTTKNSKISRIDIAYDDFEGLIDIPSIREAVLDPVNNIVSKWSQAYCISGVNVDTGVCSHTINFGSQRSDKFLTIYDKLLERRSKDIMPDVDIWNRAELKLRNNSAWSFVERLVNGKSMLELYFLVLNNQLRIVQSSDTDSNKWRWDMADHWKRFACSVLDGRVSLYSAPSDDYNEQRLENYVIGSAGAAIYTYCKVFSIYDLLKKIDSKKYKLNTKYLELINAPKEVDQDEPQQ